jgi:hypothetical protein
MSSNATVEQKSDEYGPYLHFTIPSSPEFMQLAERNRLSSWRLKMTFRCIDTGREVEIEQDDV